MYFLSSQMECHYLDDGVSARRDFFVISGPPIRGLTDEAPRRPITPPRVEFLERPDPDSAGRPRRDIEESADPSTDSA